MTLKDKVELYENFLKKIAAVDVAKEMEEALVHPNNTYVENKYPFAFGMIGQAYKNAVSDAQYALSQGKK